jgi:hypothetical protein
VVSDIYQRIFLRPRRAGVQHCGNSGLLDRRSCRVHG